MTTSDVDFKYTAKVVDGVLEQNKKLEGQKETKTAEEMNALGKDAFLSLLVCQMQNQDPLEPTSDTEWVSQLATYSSLEQMQNMNKTLTNSQALNLVGQKVILQKEDASGKVKVINGSVDFVTIKEGNAFLSVAGTLYSMDELVSIVDKDYIANTDENTEKEEKADDEH